MTKDPRVYLEHILQSIELIESYVQGHTLEEFLESVALQDQVIRRIEIIGEAARNLPEELTAKYPDVPWQRIVAMRNILIHVYFGVDLELAWQAATHEVRTLKQSIQKIKQDLAR